MKVLQAFRYIGGKSRLAPWIISYMPKHELYVEPMGGSGAVLLSKERSKWEIYNDIDGEICNFLLQVRDNYGKLQWKIERTPFSHQLYRQWREEFKSSHAPSDLLERAARWFFCMEASFRGKWGGGWFAHVGASQYMSHSQRLEDVAERLQGVGIDNLDYRTVVGKYDAEHTFFYFDPPYILEDGSNSDYFAAYQDRELFDHDALIELLIAKGIEGKWLLTYYEVDKVIKAYSMPGIYSVTREQIVSSSAMKGKPIKKRITILLANFPLEEVNNGNKHKC